MTFITVSRKIIAITYTLQSSGTNTIPTRETMMRACSNDDGLATLVLLRHGQSTWNARPTFTGWCDAPLTERGVTEAMSSGSLLLERDLGRFDVAYTSMLQRAIITCELALENAGSSETRIEKV